MSSPPLTILRKDYLELIEELITEYQITVSKAVRFCAAKLLNTFERLSKWKQTAYSLPIEKCLFWIPIFRKVQSQDTDQQTLPLDEVEASKAPRSLWDELGGEHCRETISKSVKLLKSIGLIDIQRNPHNGQDRCYWYQVFSEKLAPPPKPEPTIAPTIDLSIPPEPIAAAPVPPHPTQDDILQQLRSLGIDPNGSVKNKIAKFGDRVQSAIDYVAEQKQLWSVKNPTGLFIQSLKRGSQPSPNYQRSQPQQPITNSAYHDQTKFWAFMDSADARFQHEGLDAVAIWLNGLWQDNAHALVEHILCESKWGDQLEINREGNTVEVAF
jgi:hypothetical protein